VRLTACRLFVHRMSSYAAYLGAVFSIHKRGIATPWW